MRSLTRLAAALLVTSAAPAAAQVRPLGVELSPQAGIWEGDAVLESGPVFGLGVQFHITRVFGIEALYNAVLTEQDTTELDANGRTLSSSKKDRTLHQVGLDAVLNLGDAALTPYVSAGAGIVAVEDTHFATNIGLGARYYFTDMFGIRLDFRGWFSGDDEVPAQDSYAHFQATLGAVIQFGGDDDPDADGVPRRDDKCPTRAEDRDGFQDEDGCPDPDNDGDSIADGEDKCPNEAEDMDGDDDEDGCPDLDDDGDQILNEADKCPKEAEDRDQFEDEDGCPDPDNDHDGILDPADKCPLEPETKNGYEDEDGCPDIGDADGDGMMYPQDQCPNEAETVNGFKDGDGCPDEIPADLKAVLGVQQRPTVEPGRRTFGPKALTRFDPVVEVLAKYPDVIITIAATGHGTRDADALANARAESVRAYFVSKGLSADRLRVESLGAAPVPPESPRWVKPDRVELSIHVPPRPALAPEATPPATPETPPAAPQTPPATPETPPAAPQTPPATPETPPAQP